MGNGVSSQGNLPSHDTRDVKTSVSEGQHDWQEQAEAPETHSLSIANVKSYIHFILRVLKETEGLFKIRGKQKMNKCI